MYLVFVLTGVTCGIPEEALHLGHHSAHSREEGCKGHFVTITSVNGLASLRENEEVLPDLIELLHVFLDLNVERLGIDVVSFEEQLDRIQDGCRC